MDENEDVEMEDKPEDPRKNPMYLLPNGVRFNIDSKRFRDLVLIGQGAYGSVVSATDKKSMRRVAIKRMPLLDNVLFLKRILREIIILRNFTHPNLVKLFEILPIRNPKEYAEIYLCTDLMETDLETIVESDQTLTYEHIQYFMYQILVGLKYIHSSGIIHRDLKPGNILINSNCEIKICDFGLSIHENENLTRYVVTRWYRAPELIIGIKEYTQSIDMWSIGCIMAELFMRRPIFQGKSPIHQWVEFLKVLGVPRNDDFPVMIPPSLSQKVKKHYPNVRFPKKPRPLKEIIPKAPKEALDLIGKLLQYNYTKRYTVYQALKHPFFRELHDEDDEPVAGFRLSFDYEKKIRSINHVKELIYKQSLSYVRPKLDLQKIIQDKKK